jgi:hypothetical protein
MRKPKTPSEDLSGGFFNDDGSMRLPGQSPPARPPVRQPEPPKVKRQPRPDWLPRPKRPFRNTWSRIMGEKDDD